MDDRFKEIVDMYVNNIKKEKEGYTSNELFDKELKEYNKRREEIKTTNHITVGVYPNGDYKYNVVADTDLLNHIEYNDKLRPGRMLFVDGKYTCGMKCEVVRSIEEWETFVKTLNIDILKITKPYR